MGWAEYDYRDKDELDAALAESLRSAAHEAVAARGRAVFALAGGGTPLSLYRRAASQRAPWQEVVLLPTDERCVPHAHGASNFTALCNAWAAAEDVDVRSLVTSGADPRDSLPFAQEQLARIDDAFDFVLLGMGNDAHFASLFPGAKQLAAAFADDAPDVLRVDPDPLPPEAPFPRLSLSLPRIKRARALHLAIAGTAKREVLRRAQNASDAMLMPIAALLHADDVRVHIHWCP